MSSSWNMKGVQIDPPPPSPQKKLPSKSSALLGLKPDFNYSGRLALSWVDKVTTGTRRFVSVIAIFVAFVSLDNTFVRPS